MTFDVIIEPPHMAEFTHVAQQRLHLMLPFWKRHVIWILGATLLPLAAGFFLWLWVASAAHEAQDLLDIVVGGFFSAQAVFLATVLSITVWSRWYQAEAFDSEGLYIGAKSVSLNKDGLSVVRSGAHWQVGWPHLHGTSVTDTLIIIWLDNTAGEVLPKNQLSARDVEQLVATIAGKGAAS